MIFKNNAASRGAGVLGAAVKGESVGKTPPRSIGTTVWLLYCVISRNVRLQTSAKAVKADVIPGLFNVSANDPCQSFWVSNVDFFF
jgi:hypothetical protein